MVSSASFEFAQSFFPGLINLVLQIFQVLGSKDPQKDIISCYNSPRLTAVTNARWDLSLQRNNYPMEFSGTIDGNGIYMRNFELFPIQLLGILIGLGGFLAIQSKSKSPSWAFAFLFFGVMNLSSLGCHCFSAESSLFWRISRYIDLVCTGSSSLSLALIPYNPSARSLSRYCTYLALFCYFGDFHKLLPLAGEITYMGMMMLAIMSLGPRLHVLAKNTTVGLLMAWIGLFTIILCPVFDKVSCVYDIPMGGAHFVFLGSNVIFMAFLMMVTDTAVTSKKKNSRKVKMN